MKQSLKTNKGKAAFGGIALLAALLTSASSPLLSRAQGFGGPPPDGGGMSQSQQGGGGMGMRMGPPPGGFGIAGSMNRKMTAASAPVAAWAGALKLTSAQQSQIAAIQSSARPARPQGIGMGGPGGQGGPDQMGDGGDNNGGGPPAPPPGGFGGGPGGPGGGAEMDKRDAAASAKIDALLSAGQRAQLADVLQQMDDLRAAGIEPGLFQKLALTADQKQKLSTLATQSRAKMKSLIDNASNSASSDADGNGFRPRPSLAIMTSLRNERTKTREAAYAILTPTQLALAKSAQRNSMGGPGGGMGMGGPGGPPPDGQGPGGPGGGPGGNPDMSGGDDNGGDNAPPPPDPGE